MSDHENPAEQTQRLPKFPPRPTDTAQMPVLLIREHAVADEPEPAAPPPPPPPPGAGRGLRIALALVGLVAVAVLSGTAWMLLTGGNETRGKAVPASTTPQGGYGDYEFVQQAEQRDINCAAHAYTKVKEFFSERPCELLVQLLLTTRSKEGADVVVALSVVRMPDAAGAAELKRLTDTDNTGNVNDLLREGRRVPNGPAKLTDAGYAAALDGRAVVIAEADFFAEDRKDQDLLKRIAQDALRIGHQHAN
ncbi:hypothetical protein [Streptoalloteichus hindustanus]|uniref:Uncharacterized protein n=1 Tax=Streptoalloteichus hindustanus TaxID=2017 RepID=A0A1M5AZY8_STRHI|nr:hypothetical protein [Streptoalloteichus hindustanus]SHF35808.1 hypothetical protein SAMN05444320_103336 [Streptoalloteichus hindustanus]